MNEKCPCCGSEMSETYLGWVCMNMSLENPCSFRIAKERLPRIAAAMELARAATWADECETQRDYMDDTTSNIDAWRSIVNLELDAHHGACDAHDRIIEVFGGE